MNKEVLVTVKGLQYAPDEKADDQRIETMNRGNYYVRNGKQYVTYEESPDGSEIVKSLVKFDSDSVEITKKGPLNVHMMFETGKKNYTDYHTPYGSLVIGIDTASIDLRERENEIILGIVYDLEMNYEHVARCRIDMNISAVQ